MKEFLNRVLGIFYYLLNVVNLVEVVVNEIGVNLMLVRVGVLYYDVGKMVNLFNFIEN